MVQESAKEMAKRREKEWTELKENVVQKGKEKVRMEKMVIGTEMGMETEKVQAKMSQD